MIKEFTDIKAWQACKDLTVVTYRVTDDFPKSEQYALSSQIRRAAISSAANIAEGFGRFSHKDTEHFYVMALGSLVELKSHLLIAYELEYLNTVQLQDCLDSQTKAAQLLQGLLRSHRASSLESRASK